MNSNNDTQKTNSTTNSYSGSTTGKDKRWELLSDVKRGLEELNLETGASNQEIKNLVQATDKFKEMKEKIMRQEESLKLGLLIAHRERNVYLEKLRKIEEFGEEKGWKDDDGLLQEIYDMLYNDN